MNEIKAWTEMKSKCECKSPSIKHTLVSDFVAGVKYLRCDICGNAWECLGQRKTE